MMSTSLHGSISVGIMPEVIQLLNCNQKQSKGLEREVGGLSCIAS